MNIVFDLGGVLFHWEPEKLMAAHFPDPAEAALIDRHLHRHRDWAELDRGTLFYEEAARRSSERSGLPVERIERFLQAVAPSLTPREDTVALLRDVKNSGHPLYLLSNMHCPVIPFLE
ncbi:MAG: hypothetical protein PQJ60_12730 [Spirochaetales bacterium]|nr:hypothetical protein [Spirochaetales bacterium]